MPGVLELTVDGPIVLSAVEGSVDDICATVGCALESFSTVVASDIESADAGFEEWEAVRHVFEG